MKRSILITVITFAAAAQLFATEGINLIGVGPVQQGTAGAGVASAKDSTWLILNPAGLTDVDMGVDASLQLFAPVRTINSDPWSGGAVGTQEDDSMSNGRSSSTDTLSCQARGERPFFPLPGTTLTLKTRDPVTCHANTCAASHTLSRHTCCTVPGFGQKGTIPLELYRNQIQPKPDCHSR